MIYMCDYVCIPVCMYLSIYCRYINSTISNTTFVNKRLDQQPTTQRSQSGHRPTHPPPIPSVHSCTQVITLKGTATAAGDSGNRESGLAIWRHNLHFLPFNC